ncbi:hypothetical protein ACW7BC_29760 [Azospirillum argentinense]
MGMNANNGEYILSYFFVMLDTNAKLDGMNLLDSSAFFHEYIHFLQDIFLPYCARRNLIETRCLRLIDNVALDKGFFLPFDSWGDDFAITKIQNERTWGDNKFIDEDVEIHTIINDYVKIPYGQSIFKYIAQLESGQEYQIGARDFLEYIAHKLEIKFYEGVDAPSYPYRTVDYLFSYYGWHSVPVECRIAVAEFVLHNDHPMNLFVTVVRYVKDNSCLDLLSSYEGASHLLNNLKWNSVGGFSETATSKTVRRLRDLKDSLEDRFISDDTSAVRCWLANVIEYASNMINNRLYFSEIYQDTRKSALIKISDHINDIGVPLVFNKRMEFISLVPNKNVEDQFLNLYFSFLFVNFVREEKKRECPACRFCITNYEDIFDERCKNDPLTRWRVDFDCPMGALLRRYHSNKT